MENYFLSWSSTRTVDNPDSHRSNRKPVFIRMIGMIRVIRGQMTPVSADLGKYLLAPSAMVVEAGAESSLPTLEKEALR